MKKFIDENIFINMQDAGTYLLGNMILSYILQIKQK